MPRVLTVVNVEEVGRGGASGRGCGGVDGSRGAAERKARRAVGLSGEAETGWRVEVEEDRAVTKGLKRAAKRRPPR